MTLGRWQLHYFKRAMLYEIVLTEGKEIHF